MNEQTQFMTGIEILSLIKKKKISPVEVVEDSLARMERLEPTLNCIATSTPELAITAAKEAERKLMKDEPLGLLHGLPISVKDVIAVGGVPYALGSRTMAGNVAATDAVAVERIKTHGACIIGKTTTSEFGCKGVGDSPLTGITRNPWDVTKTPGGSSAGAASSVASGYTPFALATDGGGSLRIPGSLTGLVAIKANFSRVPVFPISATPTLIHIGPLARTVRDAALLLSAISGHDRRDAFSIAAPVPDYIAACDRPVKGMRIAWSPTLGYAKPTPEVVAITERAAMAFEDMGCIVELVDNALGADPEPMWMAEFYAGVGTRLRKQLRDTPDLLDPDVAAVLKSALDQTIDDYYAKVFERYEFREKMRKFFETYDLLLSPTLPVPAFDVGLPVPKELPDRSIVSWVYYTYPFNLTGQPAASVPAGFTEQGLPVGMQIVAGINKEVDLFRAAAALETTRPWAGRRPPVF